MKYFGTTSNDEDLASKSYVDSSVAGATGYNSVNTTEDLPINKKNVVVTLSLAQGYNFSLSSNLSAGQELFIYAKTTNPNGSMISIPVTLGGYEVSYRGTCDSTAIGTQTISLTYTASGKNISRSTATLHVFFDGSMYYIDLLSAI